jgi:RecA-family ATPase
VTVTPLRGNGTEPPRQLPSNVRAEQGLIGIILRDNQFYAPAAAIVRPGHFAWAVHARIWEAIGSMIDGGRVADVVTLAHRFAEDESLQERGGAQYLDELVKSVVTMLAAPDYAREVVRLAHRREMIAELDLEIVLDSLYRDDTVTEEIVGGLHERTCRLIANGTGGRLTGINPQTLVGLPVPVRGFIVAPWIPMRRATGLYGTGGIGKTTLLQMLCTSTALDPAKFPNANWLGLPVLHCRSVLLFCEDDLDEMHARQAEINRVYGCTFDDLGNMLWVPRLGEDTTLIAFENGSARRTPAFYELLATIKAHRARLAVWDTLTDVFGGNEIERSQARRFVQEAPAYVAREIDGAVICGAHPSLQGIKSGTGSSGSTGWDGAFRSRLYMHSPKEEEPGEPADTDERVLTRVKANWAKIGESIAMRWREGVFIADRPPGGIVGSIERRNADRVFLDLVDATARENQPVSSNNRAGNYAPRLFAKRPDRERFMVKDFEAAMQRLFVNSDIVNAPYGPNPDARAVVFGVSGRWGRFPVGLQVRGAAH